MGIMAKMSASPYKRLPAAAILILIAWTFIDILAHRLFLEPIYVSTPQLWRPFDQLNVALICGVTFGLIAIYLATYYVLVRPKSLRVGLLLGLFLGWLSVLQWVLAPTSMQKFLQPWRGDGSLQEQLRAWLPEPFLARWLLKNRQA
jgi:hypothetical protein